jgi:SAM-dependent methyltransferase
MATWDWQARLFLDQSHAHFPIGCEDRLLDIGCGPGSLLQALVHRNESRGAAADAKSGLPRYLGLDVSSDSIRMAQARFSGHTQVKPDRQRFAALGPDYLDFRAALPPGYTRLLALSVVQYYREEKELETLLRALHALAAPGALILVADLPLKDGGGTWMELKRTLQRAASLGAFGRHLLFLARCAFSSYRKTRHHSGLLQFDTADLRALAQTLSREWGARGEMLTTPLTLSIGRAHLLFTLPAAWPET